MMLCNDYYATRTYVTLRDIVEDERDQTDIEFPSNEDVRTVEASIDAIKIQEFNYPLVINEFIKYITESTWNNIYYYYDIEEENHYERTRLFTRIIAYLMKTEKRYGKLIELYKENEAKLMDKLATVSSTKFNDTPQDGGNFTDDDHVTNATETKTESDPNTIIGRLNEVKNKYRDLYTDWLNDFIKTFIIYS